MRFLRYLRRPTAALKIVSYAPQSSGAATGLAQKDWQGATATAPLRLPARECKGPTSVMPVTLSDGKINGVRNGTGTRQVPSVRRSAALKIVSSETSGSTIFLGCSPTRRHIHVRFGGLIRHPLGILLFDRDARALKPRPSSTLRAGSLMTRALAVHKTWVTAPKHVERNERNNKKPARCRSCSAQECGSHHRPE